MNEYINKEKLLEVRPFTVCAGRINDYDEGFLDCAEEARDAVKDFPAADVVPVKHGKWEGKQLDNFKKYQVACSNCGWIGIENYDSYNDPSDFNYCPNCGARMDLEGRK